VIHDGFGSIRRSIQHRGHGDERDGHDQTDGAGPPVAAHASRPAPQIVEVRAYRFHAFGRRIVWPIHRDMQSNAHAVRIYASHPPASARSWRRRFDRETIAAADVSGR
jgi:hypothetical protein